jgi:prepilin-type processing-associated H-X9-DG protein
VETLVVVAVIGGVASLLLPAVQQARESARGMVCQNNLRQIGVGLQNFHAARDFFPTTVSGSGARHFWGAQILPYLDENPLAGIYDYKVRWDDIKNREAVQTTLTFMVCPATPGGPLQHPQFKKSGTPTWGAAAADYAGSTGPSSSLWTAPAVVSYPEPQTLDGFFKGAIKPGEKGRRIRDISDGSSKTVAAFEAAARPQVWAFGRIIPNSGLVSSTTSNYVSQCGWADTNQFDVKGFKPDAVSQYKSPGPSLINGGNNAGIYAFHPSGANLLFVDGSTRFVEQAASADVVAALLTAQAGDNVSQP